MATKSKYIRGSEWRKWDLHFHTPSSYDYKNKAITDEQLIGKLKENDISVVAITDHHVIEVKRIRNLQGLGAKENIQVLPGIELRSELGGSESVHFIGIFRPDCNLEEIWTDIQSKCDLKPSTVKTKGDDKIYCDLKETCDLIHELGGLVTIHAGGKSNSLESIKNNQEFKKLLKKEIAEDYVDILELGSKDDEDDCIKIIFPNIGFTMPMVMCSDNHDASGYAFKENCWIKADPTFEGLKQILYEPKDRVWIGPVKPDQKDDFKVIRKIRFTNSTDFPDELEFNENLCSIIGSRSSGKSALLAYVAHSVDPEMTESMIDGPGQGEDYHWDRIDLEHSIEWGNGQPNEKSPGKLVYIPQNYLYQMSEDADEIKRKIEPVLFKALPGFTAKYEKIGAGIGTLNRQIAEQADAWFDLTDSWQALDLDLKNLGDKKAIEASRADIQAKIKQLEDKTKLSGEEIKQYQAISASLSALEGKIKEIDAELLKLPGDPVASPYFSGVKITTSPALATLPKKLQDEINKALKSAESGVLADANKKVAEYKASIAKEKEAAAAEIEKIKKDNKPLIEKYKSNLELKSLVTKLNEHAETVKKIASIETDIKTTKAQLTETVSTIKTAIGQRQALTASFSTAIKEEDSSALQGITFDVEYGFGEDYEEAVQRLNVKERTDFVEKNTVKLNTIREKPGEFLAAIHSKKQKVLAHHDRREVARDILALTEKVLFTANMEGDKIGGFSESTMTPGKRALFALRLILAESDDAWPLLIDQPEDDLDSRSIYDEIVPFLKGKKKERQIIMVSHNANLVIGSDSEQVIVANRNGTDRKNADGKQFNYLTGSLEFTDKKDCACEDTLGSQGVCEHACEILDGGEQAFEKRNNKYNIKK